MKKTYTEEQIAAYKAKYPNAVGEVTLVPSKFDESEEDDPCYFLVKKPSKALLTMLSSKEFKDNPEKANDALISNCVLEGDMEILNNDSSVFTGLIEKLINLSNVTKVQLKKV